MPFERCIYFNTNALARKLNARWDAAFAKFDLAPSHGYLVRLVLAEPGQSQQALANEMRLERSTVTRFITHLEKKGLLERRASPESEREKAIYPTKQALAIQADLEALGDELYATMCQTLGKKNVQAFVASIRETAEKL